jgi:hypothetical protein
MTEHGITNTVLPHEHTVSYVLPSMTKNRIFAENYFRTSKIFFVA